MLKVNQIILCQCGAIYATKSSNHKRIFRCPECGQSPNKNSLKNSVTSNSFQQKPSQSSFKKSKAKFSFSAISNLFSVSPIDRYGYFKFNNFKVLGAQLYLHWLVLTASVIITIIYWQSLISIVLALLSYFSIIFIHEAGHAAMATKVGCRVIAIRIGLVHGVCEYEQPKHELDDAKIAWSGVIMQIMMASLVFSLSSFGLSNYRFFAPILVFLGYFSLLIVPYNLIPSAGLDGKKAWRIIPIMYRQLKQR